MQILEARYRSIATFIDDSIHIGRPKTWNPKQGFPWGALDREWKIIDVGFCPSKLRIIMEAEISFLFEGQFLKIKPIFP
jgi:hypothetical protein